MKDEEPERSPTRRSRRTRETERPKRGRRKQLTPRRRALTRRSRRLAERAANQLDRDMFKVGATHGQGTTDALFNFLDSMNQIEVEQDDAATPEDEKIYGSAINWLDGIMLSHWDDSDGEIVKTDEELEGAKHALAHLRKTRETLPSGSFSHALDKLIATAEKDMQTKKSTPLSGLPPVPKTFKEAWADPLWRASICKEWQSFETNEVYELQPRSEAVYGRAISMKWIWRYKLNETGEIVRKTRCCARGFQQTRMGETPTYWGVTRHVSVLVLLTIAAQEDLEMSLTDCRTAFLSAEMDEADAVQLELPEGYGAICRELGIKPALPAGYSDVNTRLRGSRRRALVAKTLKSVYGLALAPAVFGAKLRKHLKSLGFKSLRNDDCVYYRVKDGKKMYLATTVDDILIVGHQDQIDEFNRQMRKPSGPFDIKELGKLGEPGGASRYIGMELRRDRTKREIYLTHSVYLRETVEKYRPWIKKYFPDHVTPKTPSSPPEIAELLSGAFDAGKNHATSNLPYRQLIGSLWWHVCNLRPSACFTTSVLSRSLSCFTHKHFKAALRLLLWLESQADVPFVVGQDGGRSKHNALYCYVDADFANCVETRRSTTGYVIYLNGSIVAFCARRQKAVALSTTDAEVRAATEASREILWLRHFLEELDWKQTSATDVFEDNKATVNLAETLAGQHHGKIKYMEIREKFCLDLAQRGTIKFWHCKTDEQCADLLTKSFYKHKFDDLRYRMWHQGPLKATPAPDYKDGAVLTTEINRKIYLITEN